MTTTTTKAAVQALQRQVAALEKRLATAETEVAVLRTRVDCYERMLDAVLQGLGLGRAPWSALTPPQTAPVPGFQTTGGGS